MAVRELTLEDIRPFVSDPAKAAANIEALLATLAVSQGDDAKDEELRAWASDALQSVEWVEESIADRVAEYCTHDSAAAAVWACKLIAKSSDSAGRFQSPLVEALKRHPDRTVRQQAASALGSQTRLTAQAIEALEQAASSKDPRLSRLARRSLERHEAA